MRWTKARHLELKIKNNIRGKTAYAIRSGKIKRKSCKICSNPESEAHHLSYIIPFKIIFLCRRHHKGLHRALNKCFEKYLNENEKIKK